MYASNNLYYLLKMFIPRPVQIYLRRMLIQHKINQHKDIWPIDPKSATPRRNGRAGLTEINSPSFSPTTSNQQKVSLTAAP